MDDRADAAREAADRHAEYRKSQFPTLNPAAFDNERVFIIQGFLEGVAWLEQRLPPKTEKEYVSQQDKHEKT